MNFTTHTETPWLLNTSSILIRDNNMYTFYRATKSNTYNQNPVECMYRYQENIMLKSLDNEDDVIS